MPQFPAIGAFGAFRADDELADNCAIYAVGAAHEFTNLVNGKPAVLGGTGASVASAYGPHGGALSTGGNANGFVTLGDSSDFAVGTGDFSAAICIRKGSLVNSFGFVVAGHIEILIGEGGNSTWVRWRQNNATYAGGTMFVPDVEDYQMFVYSRQNGVESHWMNGVLQYRDTIGPLNLTPASGMVIGKRGNTATYYAIPGVAMTGFWRRGLSDDEVVKLSADPFLLARPKERTYIAAAGGAHAATGALVGQGSIVTGTAARTAVHTSSGALTGQGSVIAGTAAVKRIHTSTGTLTGQIGSIAGSAARASAGPVTHAATGILTGQGSTISGLSARVRMFSATGALVGQGAVIAGTATRAGPAVTHNATGSLIGQGSIITGSALNGSSTWTITPETVSNSFTITGESITSDFTITNETISDVWIIT